MNTKIFRNDINALRAIAIVSVIVFHYNPVILNGGFIGVDIFFVISGYLMSKIIINGLDGDYFSLISFYKARINRILPALVFLSVIMMIFGWFFLLNQPYTELTKHIYSSISFFSNIIYWRESGYFDSASETKWLLHTWSLSVEWQFYLILPLSYLLLKRLKLYSYSEWIVFLTLSLSLLISIYLSEFWPTPSYYLIPTRAWEMLLGTVAFYLSRRLDDFEFRYRFHYLGVALIIFSLVIVNENDKWPGYMALIPTLGAFFVILSGYEQNYFFNHSVTQYIGKISYSLYLWHWPILVYMKLYSNYYNFIMYSILCLLMSFFSHRYIEKIRNVKFIIIFSIITILSSIIVSNYLEKFDGRRLSSSDKNFYLDRYDNYKMDPAGYFEQCNASKRYANTGTMELDSRCFSTESGGTIVWGDSHVASIATGFRLVNPNQIITQITSSGCEPSFILKRNGNSSYDRACDFSNNLMEKTVRDLKPSVVIIGTRWKHDLLDWDYTVDFLKERGVKKIIIVGPLPQWEPNLPLLYTLKSWNEKYYSGPGFVENVIYLNNYMKNLQLRRKDFEFVDVLDDFCEQDLKSKSYVSCLVKFNDDLITFDYGHLTLPASVYINQHLIKGLL
jgi:peptidoglycan/LPS O-acetylase OafA/YrhL